MDTCSRCNRTIKNVKGGLCWSCRYETDTSPPVPMKRNKVDRRRQFLVPPTILATPAGAVDLGSFPPQWPRQPPENWHHEQTFIYFIVAPILNRVKIGHSRSPTGRWQDLQTGSPEILRMLGFMDAPKSHEHELHKDFARFHVHREWFTLSKSIAAYALRHARITDEDLAKSLVSKYRLRALAPLTLTQQEAIGYVGP